MGISEDVLDGIDFLLEMADCNDSLCYADKQDQENIKAVGKWIVTAREHLRVVDMGGPDLFGSSDWS